MCFCTYSVQSWCFLNRFFRWLPSAQKQATEARLVDMVCIGLTPSVAVDGGVHILHRDLAVTTTVGEAPPAFPDPVPEILIPLGRLGRIWDRQTLHFPFEVEPLGNDVLQGSVSIAVWLALLASCWINLITGLQNWASCSPWLWGPCAPFSLMAKLQEAVVEKPWPCAAEACLLRPTAQRWKWGCWASLRPRQVQSAPLHIRQRWSGVWMVLCRCFLFQLCLLTKAPEVAVFRAQLRDEWHRRHPQECCYRARQQPQS